MSTPAKKTPAPKKAVVKKPAPKPAPAKTPAKKPAVKKTVKPAAPKPAVAIAKPAPKKPAVKVAVPAKKPTKVKASGVPHSVPREEIAKKRPTPKPPVVVKVVPGKTVTAPAVSKIAQNGFTRPKALRNDGTPKITHRVWAIADEISARHSADAKVNKTTAKPATRKEVLTACEGEQIKYSTFSNQFYRWRKFNGLFGRVKKDGTLAKPLGKTGPRKAPVPDAAELNLPVPAPVPAVKPKPPVKSRAKSDAPVFPFMLPAESAPAV